MSGEEKSPHYPSTHLERTGQRAYEVFNMQSEEQNFYAYLCAYGKILSNRRWTILAVLLVITTLVTVFSYEETPVYRAAAELEVDSETPNMQSVDNLFQAVPTDPAFLETQVDVLTSGNLALQTIRKLKLERNRAFNPLGSGHSHRAGLGQDSLLRQSRLIADFQNSLRVSLVPESRMIKVSFESTNPRLAAEVVNTLVDNYRQYNFRAKYDATRQVSGYMKQQLDDLKAKVEKSQRAMVDYERKNSIINISGKESIEDQQLAELSQDLTVAQNDLAQKESLNQLVRANPEKVGLLAQDGLLQNMEEKCADLKTSYVDAMGRYGPQFPKVVRLRDQINEIQSLIKQERTRTVERIAHDYRAALGRVKLLAGSVTSEKTKVGALNQLMIQHDLLKHEFETNQQLYDSLLAKVKDAAVSAGLKANNINLVDRARIPSVPVRPRKARNVAVGLMVGTILGVAAAFLLEMMNASIRTAEDVERCISEPVLAVIPSARSLDPSKSWLSWRRTPGALSDGKVEWAVLKHPASILAESYRTLRTAVLLSSASHPPQTVLITSTQPFEGKTATAFNLAVGLTQVGRRVLFIDADMRQDGLKRLVDFSGRAGLSSVLTGAGRLKEALFRLPDLPNLWFLSAGPQPPNPADLLSSAIMGDLLSTLRDHFDYLVVDAPPVMMVTDATVLSSLVDGVILVTESQVTGKDALGRAHKVLEEAGATILGCVLNKLDLKHDGYYGSFYRSYGGYYSQSPRKPGLITRRPTVERPRPTNQTETH